MDTSESVSKEKEQWLVEYARSLNYQCWFNPEGEIGMGRECVGIGIDGHYLEYDEDIGVKSAPDAYHKGPYLAVLGRGDDAIDQLYQWCHRLKAAGYNKASVEANSEFQLSTIGLVLGHHKTYKLLKE